MIKYKNIYISPVGPIIMTSDGQYLTELYFNKESYNKIAYLEKDLPIFYETKRWLDIYFTGQNPTFIPKYKIDDYTPFRKQVFAILKTIPYGKTMTYQQIADIIAKQNGLEKMSAQAVGGAVGKNPIWIIIPCHRVIGTNGKLIGYAGGLDNKKKLLDLENIKYKIK